MYYTTVARNYCMLDHKGQQDTASTPAHNILKLLPNESLMCSNKDSLVLEREDETAVMAAFSWSERCPR